MAIEKNSKFRPWVTKVMPTVFDDSLTYYELLSKVIGYLNQLNDQANEIIDFIDQTVIDQNQNITNLQVEFVSFRDDLNSLNTTFQSKINGDITQLRSDFNQYKDDLNALYQRFMDQIVEVDLPPLVRETLQEWFDNGKLSQIITEEVLTEIDTRILTNKTLSENNKKKLDQSHIDVKMRGAVGDGTTDDSQAIQAVVDIIPENATLTFPDGVYRITRQGGIINPFSNKTVNYGILFQNKKNIKIVFSKNAKLLFDTDGVNIKHNALLFDNCENVDIINANGEGVTANTVHELYQGAVLNIQNSKNFYILNPRSAMTGHNTVWFRSNNITVRNGFAIRKENEILGAFFGSYASDDCLIDNCHTFGGTNDGDIGIFGSPSNRVTVQNCHVFNYKYGDTTKTIERTGSQGIYVDSGTKDCLIVNNHVYGFYYGIDVKTNAQQTLVQGNVIEKCMVAVAGRLGEGNQSLNMLMIKDNIIKPNGGNGRNNFNIGGITIPIGVWLQSCYGGTIDGNIFGNETFVGRQDFESILVQVGDIAPSYQSPINIVNNQFNYENRIGTNVGSSVATIIRVLGSSSNRTNAVNIVNNTFDVVNGSLYPNLIICDYLFGLNISNNTFSEVWGDYIIKVTNSINVSVNGNPFSAHYGLLDISNSSGLSFSMNTHRPSLAGIDVPSIKLASTLYSAFTGNVCSDVNAFTDGVYIEMSGTSDWITVVGNTIYCQNKGEANWLTLVGSNNVVANNLVA